MANAVPLPSLNSHKIPVVVILYDSRIALDPDKCDTVLLYINQLYRCLGEAKKNIVGSVTYSPIYSYGSPISVNPFTVMRAQNELRGIPAGHTTGMTGDPFHMAMLNGYAAAFKMFDIFQAKYGQNANSNITYHLWHIAAGEQDNAEFAFSDLRDPRWGAVTAEIKKHNINFSMILLSECPNFSKLFHAISPAPIEPWFARCPRHTILLSGFVPPPERRDEVSQVIPAKRPARNPSEGRSRRRTMDTISQLTPPPALTLVKEEMSLTTAHPQTVPSLPPTVSPVDSQDSPILETQHRMDGQWSGMLTCPRAELSGNVCFEVLATDQVRNLNTSTWPTSLQLVKSVGGVGTLDIQNWIVAKKAPMGRIKSARENEEFDELVDSLRGGRYAIAQNDIENNPLRVLLTPLGKDLLCAVLPSSGPLDLPKPRLQQQPQHEDHPPLAEIQPTSSGSIMYREGDLPQSQPFTLTTEMLTRGPMPPQEFSMQHQQPAYIEGQLLELQAPQRQELHASLETQGDMQGDMQGAPSGGLFPGGVPLVNYEQTYFDLTPFNWMDFNPGLCVDGSVDEVVVANMMSGQASGQNGQKMSEFVIHQYPSEC